MFNPTAPGLSFDPGADYVRRYLPELAGRPADAIHDPDAAAQRRRGYSAPPVDHRAAVARYRGPAARVITGPGVTRAGLAGLRVGMLSL